MITIATGEKKKKKIGLSARGCSMAEAFWITILDNANERIHLGGNEKHGDAYISCRPAPMSYDIQE